VSTVKVTSKDGSQEDLTASSEESQTKIRNCLKKFFHRRPTKEILVKKGIYKGNFCCRLLLCFCIKFITSVFVGISCMILLLLNTAHIFKCYISYNNFLTFSIGFSTPLFVIWQAIFTVHQYSVLCVWTNGCNIWSNYFV
jgi:hypothetical protein